MNNNNIINKIVLTGGPCSGKSTMIGKLKRHFGNSAIIVPEAATVLFESGWATPRKWTQKWQNIFQAEVLKMQLRLEQEAVNKARRQKVSWIIFDRGVLDGAAYLQKGIQELCQKSGFEEKEILDRYDMVIHMESLATFLPKEYEKFRKTNPYRTEDLKEAQKKEKAVLEAWKNHKNRIFLAGPIETNFKQIIKLKNSKK